MAKMRSIKLGRVGWYQINDLRQLRLWSLWITYSAGPELVVWLRRRRLAWLRWPTIEYGDSDGET